MSTTEDPAREMLRRLVEYLEAGGAYPEIGELKSLVDLVDEARLVLAEPVKPGPATDAMLDLTQEILPWADGKMNGPGNPETAAKCRAFLAEHGWEERP